MSITEQELFAEFKKHEAKLRAAIVAIVKNKDEVDDLLQDTLISAWKGREQFKGDSLLYTWLYRIALNKAKNFLASEGRRGRFSEKIDWVEADDMGMMPLQEVTPEDELEGEQLHDAMQKALKRIPKDFAKLVRASYRKQPAVRSEVDGRLCNSDYRGLAKKYGLPVNTVRSRLHRGRKAIREILLAKGVLDGEQ